MTPFQVDISSSTQDFTAAMPLTLTCEATSGAVPPLTYSWSSTCSGECFIASQVTTSQISTPALRAADSGEYSCTAADSVGNIGTNVITVSTEGEKQFTSKGRSCVTYCYCQKVHFPVIVAKSDIQQYNRYTYIQWNLSIMVTVSAGHLSITARVTESQMGLQCAFQPALTGHLSITASFLGPKGDHYRQVPLYLAFTHLFVLRKIPYNYA